MIKINRKSFYAWIVVTIGVLFLPFFINQDSYLIMYSLIIYLYAIWGIFCIGKKIVNTLLIFSIFYGVLLFFGPIMLFEEGYSYYTVVGNYIIISFLCFAIGYSSEKFLKYKGKEIKVFLPAKNNPEMIYLLSLILFCIGISMNIIYFIKDWNTIFGTDLENGRIIAMKGNGLLLWLGELSWLAIYILYEQRLIHDKYHRTVNFMIGIKTIISLFFGFRNALVNPILVLFFMKNKKRDMPVRKMLLLVLVLSIFVGVYGAIRGGDSSALNSLLHEFKVSSVNLNNILESFPNRVNFQNGATYLFDILAIFDSNVEGTTLWMKKVLNLSFSGGGVTPTVIGEFYMNWGITGVLIGMVATGLFFKKIEKSYRNQDNSIFLPCLFLGYIRPIIRGGYANSSVNLLVFIIGYCGCQYIAKKYKVQKVKKERF